MFEYLHWLDLGNWVDMDSCSWLHVTTDRIGKIILNE